MYQRVKRGVWHYRIKLKTGEWYRLSSRETDFDEAKEIAQMRKVRDQMRVIKLKRNLEKEKEKDELYHYYSFKSLLALYQNIIS